MWMYVFVCISYTVYVYKNKSVCIFMQGIYESGLICIHIIFYA